MDKCTKTWCPRCNQGWIVSAKIKKTKEQLFVCEECDATWLSLNNIGKEKWLDFGSFMESKQLPALWTELDVHK